MLRALYPYKKTSVLADMLGVKLNTVRQIAHRMGLEKNAEFRASPDSGRLDGARGTATRFKPGRVSWAKGQKGIRLSIATEFKKGDAPANVQDVGALRINSMGEIDIKTAPGKNKWLSLRRFAWELENGPIPEGMCIVAINGDGHDTRIENLALLTRAENIKHNLLDRYPKELRNVMALVGRVKSKIHQRLEQAETEST